MDSRKPPDGSIPALSPDELRAPLLDAARGAAIARLSAGVAHDLRNPLNALAIQLELIADKVKGLAGGEVPATLQKNLASARGQISRFDAILRRFAEWAAEAEPREQDAASVAADVFALCGHELRRAGVAHEVRCGEGLSLRTGRGGVVDALVLLCLSAAERGRPGAPLRLAVEGGDDETADPVDDATLWVVEHVVRAQGGRLHFHAGAGLGAELELHLPRSATVRSAVA